MKWTVVLDNGKTYSVIADNLLDISLKLQERDLITSDYDILAVMRIKQRFSKIFQIWKILESARAKNFLKKHLTN